MELEMLCRISSCGAMNSVSKCFTFFPQRQHDSGGSVLLLLFAVVVVAVVGSKAIHKHFTFMPKVRLQSECEKCEVRTETDTRVQWHQNQSQSSFHQRETFFPCMRSKWSVNAVTEISIHLIFYLYLMRIVYVMHVQQPCILRCNQCWHSIRGFAWNHNHHHQHHHITALTHTHTRQTFDS